MPMKLEDQCVSLELDKRLKELGVKQDSYFLWGRDSFSPEMFITDDHVLKMLGEDCWFSAFTVAELGKILPVGCSSRRIS